MRRHVPLLLVAVALVLFSYSVPVDSAAGFVSRFHAVGRSEDWKVETRQTSTDAGVATQALKADKPDAKHPESGMDSVLIQLARTKRSQRRAYFIDKAGKWLKGRARRGRDWAKKQGKKVAGFAKKHGGKIVDGINKGIGWLKDGWETLTLIPKVLKCVKALHGKGGRRVCLPKKCVEVPTKKPIPKSYDEVKRVFPHCSGSEKMCLPSIVKLPLPSFIKKYIKKAMSTCPVHCPSGAYKHAICLPNYLKDFKIDTRVPDDKGPLVKDLMWPCPTCTKLCMPTEFLHAIDKKYHKYLNIPPCVPKACGKTNRRSFCLPEWLHPILKHASGKLAAHYKFREIPSYDEDSSTSRPYDADTTVDDAVRTRARASQVAFSNMRVVYDGQDSEDRSLLTSMIEAQANTRDTLGLPGLGKLMKGMSTVIDKFPRCSRCEQICLPKFFGLEKALQRGAGDSGLGRALKDLLPPCKLSRQCGIHLERPGGHEICLPQEVGHFKSLLPKGFRDLVPVCPTNCPKLCLPPRVYRMLPENFRSLVDDTSCYPGCPSPLGQRTCLPHFMKGAVNHISRHLPVEMRGFGSVAAAWPVCDKCTELCCPSYIKLHGGRKDLEFINKLIPTCPKPTCTMPPVASLCLPSELAPLKNMLDERFRAFVPDCPACPNMCMPKEVISTYVPTNFRGFFGFTDCYPASCPQKDSEVKRKFCFPSYLSHALKHLASKLPPTFAALGMADLLFPKCEKCEKTCLPPYIHLSGHSNAMVKKMSAVFPPCASECPATSKKTRNICLPKQFAFARIAIPKDMAEILPDCKDHCEEPCIPRVMLPMIKDTKARKALELIQDCHTCDKTKLAPCVPEYLKGIVVNVINKQGSGFKTLAEALPVCQKCETMCLPRWVRLTDRLKQLQGVIPLCPETAQCAKREISVEALDKKYSKETKPKAISNAKTSLDPAICIPKELKGMQKLLGDDYKSLMPICPECVEPCLPEKMPIAVPFDKSIIQQCKQDAGCAKVKLFQCMPHEFRFMKHKYLDMLRLPVCEHCVSPCLAAPIKALITSQASGIDIQWPDCPIEDNNAMAAAAQQMEAAQGAVGAAQAAAAEQVASQTEPGQPIVTQEGEPAQPAAAPATGGQTGEQNAMGLSSTESNGLAQSGLSGAARVATLPIEAEFYPKEQ